MKEGSSSPKKQGPPNVIGLRSGGPLVTMSTSTPVSSAVSVQIQPRMTSTGSTSKSSIIVPPPGTVPAVPSPPPVPPSSATPVTPVSTSTPKINPPSSTSGKNNSGSSSRVRNALHKLTVTGTTSTNTTSSTAPSSAMSDGANPPSLEMEADAFFEGEVCMPDDSFLLSPSSSSQLLIRLWHLCHRRAWSDVLQVSNELLLSTTNATPYSAVYQTVFVVSPGIVQTAVETDSVSNEVLEATCEILAWRWKAFLQLRRKTDLKRDLDHVQHSFLSSSSDQTKIPSLMRIYFAQTMALIDTTTAQHHDDHKDDDDDDDGYNEYDYLYQLLEQYQHEPYLVAKLHLIFVQLHLSSTTNFPMAIHHIQALFQHLQQQQQDMDDSLWKRLQFEIHSLHGHVLLQMGSTDKASQIFHLCSTLIPSEEQVRIQMQTGLLQFANLNYTVAFQEFSQALQTLQQQYREQQQLDTTASTKIVYPLIINVMNDWTTLFSSLSPTSTTATPIISKSATQTAESDDNIIMTMMHNSSFDKLFSSCCNNLALTALYTCRLSLAIQTLEDLVRTNPTFFLTSTVAFNLCTLYELGHDTPVSERKKKILKLIAKRFYLHDLGDKTSFRLT